MSLTGRWIDLIFRVATGSWKVRLLVAPLVGLFYAGLIGSFILLAVIADRWLGLPAVPCPPWSLGAGVPLLLLGFLLMVYSLAHFIRVRGTPVPFSPPPRLVDTGPYRYARNPMLTGIFAQLFGLGLLLSSLSLFCFFTPLFILINAWELKFVEEPELEKRLGEDYRRYKKRVPMFFPRFKGVDNP